MSDNDREKLNCVLNTQVKDNRSLKRVVLTCSIVIFVILTIFSIVVTLLFRNTKQIIEVISDRLDEGVTITVEEVDGTVGDWNVTKDGDIYK